jgi:hypothetical protein
MDSPVTTVEALFPKLTHLLKAYHERHPEYRGAVPTLGDLQSVRCSKAECYQPRKNYMDPMPCAWCEEHMPKKEDISVFKEPMPTLVGSKQLRREKASVPPLPKKPVKRRLTYEEKDVRHDVSRVFFESVHARYQQEHRWLRPLYPLSNQTINNNLSAIEVHLQQLREDQDKNEESLRYQAAYTEALNNKVYTYKEDMEEKLQSVVESINRIDDSLDTIQANVTDLCKIVNDFLNKQK